ncbi:MAG: hypothetical protein JWN38_585 [Candidatus Saccharibacteria bacterium]|nr:hypothetical protein [Candidatus Saccharibacteria bacterium]
MNEKLRTVLLLLLLAVGIGFIFWMRSQYTGNFTDGL